MTPEFSVAIPGQLGRGDIAIVGPIVSEQVTTITASKVVAVDRVRNVYADERNFLIERLRERFDLVHDCASELEWAQLCATLCRCAARGKC